MDRLMATNAGATRFSAVSSPSLQNSLGAVASAVFQDAFVSVIFNGGFAG
jgi:hypothetical protein